MGLIDDTTKIPLVEKTTNKLVPILNNPSSDMDLKEEGSFYILIPLGVFVIIILLSLMVYLMARNRRRLAHIYCKKLQSKKQNFNYDNDSPLEQDTEALPEEEDNEDNPTKSLLRGKLQINNRYENYLSTSHLNKSSELFA
ncbi:uncharacterized protein LOC142221034 [Haematobia irritans]|uniref:uncharacterized protein LOC142221034 n=1 Tax=Haematobia irritans TaxID=7368 RepID=UPI003F4FBAF8